MDDFWGVWWQLLVHLIMYPSFMSTDQDLTWCFIAKEHQLEASMQSRVISKLRWLGIDLSIHQQSEIRQVNAFYFELLIPFALHHDIWQYSINNMASEATQRMVKRHRRMKNDSLCVTSKGDGQQTLKVTPQCLWSFLCLQCTLYDLVLSLWPQNHFVETCGCFLVVGQYEQ